MKKYKKYGTSVIVMSCKKPYCTCNKKKTQKKHPPLQNIKTNDEKNVLGPKGPKIGQSFKRLSCWNEKTKKMNASVIPRLTRSTNSWKCLIDRSLLRPDRNMDMP